MRQGRDEEQHATVLGTLHAMVPIGHQGALLLLLKFSLQTHLNSDHGIQQLNLKHSSHHILSETAY